jgi:hypothetical protein
MRALRWTAASLLGLLGGVLGLVGALLCVTLILLPLGIPILFLSRKLFRTAGQLVVPREVRHPVKEAQERSSGSAKSARKKGRRGRKLAAATMQSATDSVRKTGKKAGKKAGKKGTAKGAKNILADAASTAREKAPVPGRRSRMDKVRQKLHLA